MGMFGGKKSEKEDKSQRREKPTTARRSRRIVQPGAGGKPKTAATPGPGAGTKQRSPEPQVRRKPPAQSPPADDLLDLDDFSDAPAAPSPKPTTTRRKPASADVPDLDFQGSLGGEPDLSGGPCRSGDAVLLEFLVNKAELVSQEQAQSAQLLAQDEGLPVDAALVRQGAITEDALVHALAGESWVPHLKVDKYEIRKKALNTISAEEARHFGVLPVDKLGSVLNLAMVNPLDQETIRALEAKTGLEVKRVVATRSEIERCIVKYFGGEAGAVAAPAHEESRRFEQDVDLHDATATQPMSPPAPAAAAAAAADAGDALASDDFLDIADIDDLLGSGDEVAPALVEPVALEPIEAEPEPQIEENNEAESLFAEPEPTSAPAPAQPAASASDSEDDIDLGFAPEPPAAAQPAPASEENIFADFEEPSPAPAQPSAPSPTASSTGRGTRPQVRSGGRSATATFTAKSAPAPSPASAPRAPAPAMEIEDLIPVTEEDFQNAIAHGRIRVFEKWVGIQTRNRVLNAVSVVDELDPLLEDVRATAYAVSA